jgi:hypothetical protein
MPAIGNALLRGDRVFIIIDASNAGALGFDVNAMLQELMRPPKGSVFALMASTPMESVADNDESFTSFLIRGWQGAADANDNGAITLTELMDYLEYHVVAATGGAQHPLFAGNGKPDAVLPQLLGKKIFAGEKLPPKLPIPPPPIGSTPPPNYESDLPPPMEQKTAPPSGETSPSPTISPRPNSILDALAGVTGAMQGPGQTANQMNTSSTAKNLAANDTEGGIDIASAVEVPSEARAALARALAADGFKLRNWKVLTSNAPSSVMVKYYFAEDATNAGKIRADIGRVLGEKQTGRAIRIDPPAGYRPGQVDIWLSVNAIKQLMGAPKPASAK